MDGYWERSETMGGAGRRLKGQSRSEKRKKKAERCWEEMGGDRESLERYGGLKKYGIVLEGPTRTGVEWERLNERK